MFRFAASVVCALPLWLGAAHATESECVVASVHPLATDAGLDAYRNGGNALDAAVATALTLGVVDTHNSGLGGGCFILVRLPSGELLAIDGRETAPAAATADMYVRNGKADPELSRRGRSPSPCRERSPPTSWRWSTPARERFRT